MSKLSHRFHCEMSIGSEKKYYIFLVDEDLTSVHLYLEYEGSGGFVEINYTNNLSKFPEAQQLSLERLLSIIDEAFSWTGSDDFTTQLKYLLKTYWR